jgi:hypothetical protein
VRVVRPWGDLDAVARERPADRSDPVGASVLRDELADHRDRGSLSRAKKVVAAFKISIVRSSLRVRTLERSDIALRGRW